MGNKLRPWVPLFIVATLVALAARLFLVETFRISSESMDPGLLQGDLALATKFNFSLRLPFSTYELFRIRAPQKSEIVVFTLPGRGMESYVKRVVAVEGERVELRDGVFLRNGSPATYRTEGAVEWEEPPGVAPFPVHRQVSRAKNYGPIDIPKGHFFALGDNREESVDSRVWGPIPYSSLLGKTWFIWFSVAPEGGLRSGRYVKAIQ